MAGDWIPIRCDLHATPEVLRIASAIKRSTDEVVGLLVRFWGWAQSQSSDGHLEGLDLAMAAAACHVPDRFVQALVSVGWLVQTDSGLCIPNFDRWLGNSGKKRLQAVFRKRQERQRKGMSRNCHADVTLMSRAQRDTSVTIEEKRREEYKVNSLPPIKDPPSLLSPTSPDGDSSANADAARPDPDWVAFLEWWKWYPRKVGKQAAYRAYVNARKRLCKEKACAPAEARQLLSDACVAFAGSRKAKSEFCPHPATWLNQGRYEDDPAEWDRMECAAREPTLDDVLEQALKGTG